VRGGDAEEGGVVGYDLRPVNKSAGNFHFGAFSFPIVLEACGYLFPAITRGSEWYMPPNDDPRFDVPEGATPYPGTLSNAGFAVTAEEACIMARVARNYVAVQRSLDAEVHGWNEQRPPGWEAPWPGTKIREDFIDKFAAFAEWAPRSGGFEIL
jgi:hypothetical protein